MEHNALMEWLSGLFSGRDSALLGRLFFCFHCLFYR
jgi:hypothetical protein